MSTRVIERHADTVAEAIHTWLAAEVMSSGQDHNRVLDDYDKAVTKIEGGTGYQLNFTGGKHQGHMDRLPLFFKAYKDTPDGSPNYDKAEALVAFGGLMEISGGYRNQCYVTAKNKQQYLAKRKKVIGISLVDAVSVRLHTRLPSSGNFAGATIDVASLEERMLRSISNSDAALKTVFERAGAGLDMGQEYSTSVEALTQEQYNWTAFVTDCITLAAKRRRGDLAAVPLLDAQSISKIPQPYYPFRGELPPVTAG